MDKILKITLCIFLLFIQVEVLGQPTKPFTKELPFVAFTNSQQVGNGYEDYTLLSTITSMIDAAPENSSIKICVFKFSDKHIISALSRAKERGVEVYIILNKGPTSDDVNKKSSKELKEKFKNFHYIENDISGNAIIHNKFILFSELLTASKPLKHVLVQTSSNFTKKDAIKAQDLTVFTDKELYVGFEKYWDKILKLSEKDDLKKYKYSKVENSDHSLKAYFFPKQEDKEQMPSDNIEEILKDISEPSTAFVAFVHGKWSEHRENIIEQISVMVSQGAEIHLLSNESLDSEVRSKLLKAGAKVHLIDTKKIQVHTKIMFFDAVYKGARQSIVLTGSHNLTRKSLHTNFEVLLKISDEKIYASYKEYALDLATYSKLRKK